MLNSKALCYTAHMSQIVAIDFGGTNIRVAYFPTPEPPPAKHSKLPTCASDGPQAVITRIIEAIQAILPSERENLRIGVGSPGPVNPHKGLILKAVNLPGWVNIPIRALIQEQFGCHVAVGNDANVAALGEWRFGAGKGTSNLIYLTISTGIGGGVIMDGQLLLGAQGLGTELGHMTVEPEGPICSCGQLGHLEAVAAGPALARQATAFIETGRPSILAKKLDEKRHLTGKDVGEAAQEGDPLAGEIIERAGEIIGRHMADLAHAFNPEVFVLGGGVSQLGPLLFEPVERSLRAHVMNPAYVEDLRVVPAALGDDAGLIGAMVLASQ